MRGQQRQKVKKTVSEPNLYVVRNGKLCQRTPKNNNGNNLKPTTKVIHVNHTINHLICDYPLVDPDKKGVNIKKQYKSFFNDANLKQENELTRKSNTNLSSSKRLILNNHLFGEQSQNNQNQQSFSGLKYSNNHKIPVKLVINSKQTQECRLPQKVNYYEQTIKQLKKQIDRLRIDYQDLQKQYWSSLNQKLQIISQNSLVDKYQDKVEQCIRAVEKIQQSGLEVPKTQMNIHRHNFVYNRLENIKKFGNSARAADQKRLLTQATTQSYSKNTDISHFQRKNIFTQGKLNKDHPVSNSIILSDTSIKFENLDQYIDSQTNFTSRKNINTLKSVKSGSINQSSQQYLRYILQQRVKVLQSLAHDIIKQHKQLIQKLVFFKERSTKFQTQIISMKQEHYQKVKNLENDLFYFKTEFKNNVSNMQGLRLQLKRKEELIESLVKRIKTRAQQDYGYHYLK